MLSSSYVATVGLGSALAQAADEVLGDGHGFVVATARREAGVWRGQELVAWYLARAQRRVSLPTSLLWLVIDAAVVGVFYFVFTRYLHVRLPQGMFF